MYVSCKFDICITLVYLFIYVFDSYITLWEDTAALL